MRRLRALPTHVLGLAAVVLLGGCLLESAGASRKFSDTVEQLNKATRWGQLGDAARLVDTGYREQFSAQHAHWGHVIQVADTEVVQLDLGADKATATAVISYEWYLTTAMTLHQSVVRQHWSSRGHSGQFALLSESVIEGDGRLLSPNAAQTPVENTGPGL